jgi:hypothetical protein
LGIHRGVSSSCGWILGGTHASRGASGTTSAVDLRFTNGKTNYE